MEALVVPFERHLRAGNRRNPLKCTWDGMDPRETGGHMPQTAGPFRERNKTGLTAIQTRGGPWALTACTITFFIRSWGLSGEHGSVTHSTVETLCWELSPSWRAM